MLSNISTLSNQKIGMPFTMNFASTPEILIQDIVDDMGYNAKQQTNIIAAPKKGGSSTCSRTSGTTNPKSLIGFTRDSDPDTQQDD